MAGHRERGAGVVVTAATVPMAIVAVLFLSHLALRLHAGGRLAAAAEDAARQAADDRGRVEAAERALRDALGPAGPSAVVRWTVDQEQVALVVRMRAPALAGLGGVDLLPDSVSTSTRSRIERWR